MANKIKKWEKYFNENKDNFDYFDWENIEKISEKEKEIIKKSIQQFQKWEYSEGKWLIKYVSEAEHVEYLNIIKLFIKEEQKHSFMLWKFMDLNNIERKENYWIDEVFRWLRNLAGLEQSLLVLSIAEIIAIVYYDSLWKITSSNSLLTICNRIQKDEQEHLKFQAFMLNGFYNKKNMIKKIWFKFLHRFIMTGTIFIVWPYHKKVLTHKNKNFIEFYKNIMNEFHRLNNLITK